MQNPLSTTFNTSRTAAVGGLSGILGGATLMFPTPDPEEPGFLAFNTCNVVAFVLLIVATAALGRLGAGPGILGRLGLVAALTALTGFAVVEFATRHDSTIGEAAHPITVPLLALGMTAVGIAVIRAGVWRGWARLTPLLCGLVPLLVELPIVVLFGPIGVVIALPWSTWILLGLAELSIALTARHRSDDAHTTTLLAR